MAFHHYLLQIEALSLFQNSGKISIRFLVFVLIYVYFFHPKIERQSEIANQEIEIHLCNFINYY